MIFRTIDKETEKKKFIFSLASLGVLESWACIAYSIQNAL